MGGRAAGKHYAQVVLKPLLLALALALSLAIVTDARAQGPLASVSASPAPATAAAPPLPFRYIGRLRVDGRLEVLLMRGTKVYSTPRGGEIDGEYRIERITESSISFTYLPLQARQDLDL